MELIELFAWIIAGYIFVDTAIFVIVSSRILSYRTKQGRLAHYAYLPLINVPMAIYEKYKYGDIGGDYKTR